MTSCPACRFGSFLFFPCSDLCYDNDITFNFLAQASDAGVREAILTALKGVLKHAGKSVSDPVRVRVFSQLKDLIHHDEDQVRISAASILGITSQVGLGILSVLVLQLYVLFLTDSSADIFETLA